jgi:hypothetical protein
VVCPLHHARNSQSDTMFACVGLAAVRQSPALIGETSVSDYVKLAQANFKQRTLVHLYAGARLLSVPSRLRDRTVMA